MGGCGGGSATAKTMKNAAAAAAAPVPSDPSEKAGGEGTSVRVLGLRRVNGSAVGTGKVADVRGNVRVLVEHG